MNPIGLFIVGAGIFSICGGAFDWDWFMESRKAQIFVWVFGRSGARIVYGLLGAVLVIFGVLTTIGAVSLK